MKKVFILLLMFVALTCNAQTSNVKVTLKSGVVISGTLKELVVTDHITVNVSGVESIIPMTEVDKIDHIEGKDNVNLTVYRNIKYGTGSYDYQYMVEALNEVIKLTGIDLKSMFEDRINEDMKKLDPQAQEIKEQLEANKEAQFQIRKKKIAMLAEQYKNDPVKIALLSKVAKDLSLLEK